MWNSTLGCFQLAQEKKKYVCILMSVEKEDMKAALFKDNNWCFGVRVFGSSLSDLRP